jgi:hypothetical protein
MDALAMRAGVCIVRFEPEPDRWLVTVTTIWPLAPDNYAATPSRTRHFADTESAIEAVAGELRRVLGASDVQGVELGIRAPRNDSAAMGSASMGTADSP